MILRVLINFMDQMPTTQTCCCDLVTLYIDDTASREAVDWLDQLADCEDDLNDVGISIVKVKPGILCSRVKHIDLSLVKHLLRAGACGGFPIPPLYPQI